MKLVVTIEMDNDAFVNHEGKASHVECKRILEQLAVRLPYNAIPEQEWKLRDYNGNTVGKAEVIE